MDDRQILYEARLSKTGSKMVWAGIVALVVLACVAWLLCFKNDTFPGNLMPLCIFGLFGIATIIYLRRGIKMKANPGFYRISIDDYALYVQSEDPDSTRSFEVIAPDIHCLVRKTVRESDSAPTFEYYVDTKSGQRHRIEQFFVDLDLDALSVFDKITDRFHWVQIFDEDEEPHNE
jgi:hypothetical protein